MATKTIESLAFLCTRIVAQLDDDPYGEGDIILPPRAVSDLRELHVELHKMRRVIHNEISEAATLDAVKDRYIDKVLALSGGNYARASKVLDISESTLYRYRKNRKILGNSPRHRNGASNAKQQLSHDYSLNAEIKRGDPK